MGTTPLGNYLKTMREAAGISVREAARRVHVSHVFLGELERGVRKGIKEERVKDFCAGLPGVMEAKLRSCLAASRPVEIDLTDAPQYRPLAMALARKDIGSEKLKRIMKIIGHDDD